VPASTVQPGIGEQVPSRPCTLQDMHGAAQAELQQTRCAQKPVAHSLPLWQLTPMRSECPLFDAWMKKLEAWGQA